jgi:hypothetical protein
MSIGIALYDGENFDALPGSTFRRAASVKMRADSAEVMFERAKANFCPDGTAFDFWCVCHDFILDQFLDQGNCGAFADTFEHSPNPPRAKLAA